MAAESWLLGWSVAGYRLLLYLYPTAFRRECGAAMQQAFRDLARDAWRTSGAWGLAAVWFRTGIDVVKSVPVAYFTTRDDTMGRFALGAGALYILYLLAFVGYGASHFSRFYEPRLARAAYGRELRA